MGENQGKSDWIWTEDWTAEDREQVRIVCFRKTLELSEAPAPRRIRITASSRYKLYVNGEFVQAGPEKGTKEFSFVDEAELGAYLRKGSNVLAVEVLRYPENSDRRNDSIVHTEYPGLYVEDITESEAGQEEYEHTQPAENGQGEHTLFAGARREGNAASLETRRGENMLSGRSGWKCKKAEHIHLEAEGFRPAPIHARESVAASESFFGWKEAEYDDGAWEAARVYGYLDSRKPFSPFWMRERDIPYMEMHPGRLREVVCCREYEDGRTETGESICRRDCENEQAADRVSSWNALIQKGTALTVAAHSRQTMELSAGELVCAWPLWKLSGGKGAKLTVLWSECYYPEDSGGAAEPGAFLRKKDRTDYENGRLVGYEETYCVTGLGTDARPETYEPYWFKTFRFLRVCVETGDEPLDILDFSYRTTGYPLEVQTRVHASDESFAPIWEICERTLRLCMHETYVDCPFYEQLQYVMDSRLEILATYTTAADDRLARQCMEAFRCSQQCDGLLKASAPTEGVNIIPGFSIYFIMMVHDHMMYFGDRELVRHHMNCIDSILNYFGGNLSEKGVVRQIGGILFENPHWSFIDWTREWDQTIGVPTASLKGDCSLTMESLYYLYGLQLAAELAEYIGRKELAADYMERAGRLKEAVRRWCTGESGLIQDGPGVEEYSVHCQIFSILTDVVTKEEGRRNLEHTLDRPGIAQCSFAMCFYLFRALEKLDWYEKADGLWEMWRQMLRDHMTTCGEDPLNGRSECHGWSALLLYEMPAVYLGVRPAAPGFAKIAVCPVAGHLTSAGGDVVTPKGIVHVEWTKDGAGNLLIKEIKVPDAAG